MQALRLASRLDSDCFKQNTSGSGRSRSSKFTHFFSISNIWYDCGGNRFLKCDAVSGEGKNGAINVNDANKVTPLT